MHAVLDQQVHGWRVCTVARGGKIPRGDAREAHQDCDPLQERQGGCCVRGLAPHLRRQQGEVRQGTPVPQEDAEQGDVDRLRLVARLGRGVQAPEGGCTQGGRPRCQQRHRRRLLQVGFHGGGGGGDAREALEGYAHVHAPRADKGVHGLGQDDGGGKRVARQAREGAAAPAQQADLRRVGHVGGHGFRDEAPARHREPRAGAHAHARGCCVLRDVVGPGGADAQGVRRGPAPHRQPAPLLVPRLRVRRLCRRQGAQGHNDDAEQGADDRLERVGGRRG
mmetsp:Transcript_17331/g.59255  ORF Transcript_17331/g.59255 Transcript_17331/m.59255 type:complete len:279 (+) Transcript_17331:2074-2910(+)